MKKGLNVLLALVLTLTGCASQSATTSQKEVADVVVLDAKVYTQDENNTIAEAFAVKDGKITAVGNNDDVKQMIGDDTKVIEADGQVVMPSLIDAHTHPGTVSATAWYTALPADVYTYDDIRSYIQNYLAEHSIEEQPYIYFEYYPSDLFDENGPRKEWLDEISDRPILVEDFSDHACWVNSKFLELIGVYDLPEDTYGLDNFIKDETGDYTGWIKEGEWKKYIHNLYETLDFYPPEEITPEVISIMLDDLKEWGVTGVFDAFIENETHIASVRQLDDEGKLNMNYDAAVMLPEYEMLDEIIDTIQMYDDTYGNDHITVDTIKIFYDGTNELGNSALVDGTVQNPDDHGYLMMDLDQTKDTIRRANEAGLDVHFHLVGDLAFRNVCDATEELLNELGSLDIQVEVCHAELVNEVDYDRPAQLGIIVNWTPHWSGGYFGDAALQYLGQERYDSMYQFNPMIESGAIVTFGSDVYSMYEENRANPYFGMQTAMTRVDIEIPLESGMRESASAKLSMENLFKGYTIQAAKQLRIDDKVGSLEIGKDANFNMYVSTLFETNEDEVKDILPTVRYFEGKEMEESL